MQRVIVLLAILTLAAVSAVVLVARPHPAPLAGPSATLTVAATFYPLAETARRIGGDRVTVATIVPPGAEPHDYEPTPRDIETVSNARIFMMNGGVDAWAERLRPELERSGIVTVRVADRLPEISEDPHVWLDPARAKVIVGLVRDALIEVDPEGTAVYRAGAERYENELDELDRAYARGLRACGIRAVVTSHDALGYLAERYDFKVVPIAGISPEEEPSPRRMAEIAAVARSVGANYVFFETLLSSKIAKTLADEIGAGTLVFDPIEGLTPEAQAAGKNYLAIMRHNLVALETAMACE